MINYDNYINEGYFRQNLYHFTTLYPLKKIFEEDKLDLGYYDNPVNGENKRTLSLTRNKNFKLERYSTLILEFDGDLLYQDYKIIPYDYYMQSGKETKTKSDPNRKHIVQSEEIILKPLYDVHKYLVSVEFYDYNDIYKETLLIEKLLELNSEIKFKYKNKVINYGF